MSNTIEHSTILVELDCLLDTRIGCVYKNRPDLFEHILNRKYHQRYIDNFYPGYDSDYAKRDITILKNSAVTPVAQIIKEFSLDTYLNSLNTPFVKKPRVRINTYPYDIQDPKWIIAAIVAITDKKADVEVVSMKPEEVTPQYLKNHISVVVMYDYTKWLDMHSLNENFKFGSCPSVKMMAPAIFFKEVTREDALGKDDPFDAMEKLAQPLIDLRLLPIESFSFTFNEKKKDTDK